MMKYNVTAPVKSTTGKAWGLMFIAGVAQTDDKRLAKKLAKKGYAVEEVKEVATKDGSEGEKPSSFVCAECGKEYKTEDGLNKHIAKAHGGVKGEDEPAQD